VTSLFVGTHTPAYGTSRGQTAAALGADATVSQPLTPFGWG